MPVERSSTRVGRVRRWSRCTASCCGWCLRWRSSRGGRGSCWATGCRRLERLVEATYTRDRRRHLDAANLGIEKLRFLFRLAKDLGHLDHRRYAHAARTLDRDRSARLAAGGGRMRRRRADGLFDRIATFEALGGAALRAILGQAAVAGARRVPRQRGDRGPASRARAAGRDVAARRLRLVRGAGTEAAADLGGAVPGDAEDGLRRRIGCVRTLSVARPRGERPVPGSCSPRSRCVRSRRA